MAYIDKHLLCTDIFCIHGHVVCPKKKLSEEQLALYPEFTAPLLGKTGYEAYRCSQKCCGWTMALELCSSLTSSHLCVANTGHFRLEILKDDILHKITLQRTTGLSVLKEYGQQLSESAGWSLYAIINGGPYLAARGVGSEFWDNYQYLFS